jgi:hypothetical protein
VIQVRDFEYSPEAQESRKQELEKLMHDQESLRSSLLQWCYTSYGEVFFFLFYLSLRCLFIQQCSLPAYTGQNLPNCCFELQFFSVAVSSITIVRIVHCYYARYNYFCFALSQ